MAVWARAATARPGWVMQLPLAGRSCWDNGAVAPTEENRSFQMMADLLRTRSRRCDGPSPGLWRRSLRAGDPGPGKSVRHPRGRAGAASRRSTPRSDAASPTVRNQHVVSRALLARWCDLTKDGPRMGHYSLEFGARPLTSPKSVAKLTDFVKFDSEATERLWNLTERVLPEALAAAQDGTLFRSPQHVKTLKETIALHYARSFEVLDTHDEIWTQGLEVARARFLKDPKYLSRVHYLKTGMYLPATATEAQRVMADGLLQHTRDLFVSGVAFRFRVVRMFNQVSTLVARAGLQLLRPEGNAEFLIADVPAITTDASSNHQSIRAGVPIGSAASVFLPLGPHLGVGLGPRDEDLQVNSGQVERLNTWEVLAARHGVFMRAGSPLATWVATIRPPTGPRRP